VVPGWHGGGDIHGGDSKASIDRLTWLRRDPASLRRDRRVTKSWCMC